MALDLLEGTPSLHGGNVFVYDAETQGGECRPRLLIFPCTGGGVGGVGGEPRQAVGLHMPGCLMVCVH